MGLVDVCECSASSLRRRVVEHQATAVPFVPLRHEGTFTAVSVRIQVVQDDMTVMANVAWSHKTR